MRISARLALADLLRQLPGRFVQPVGGEVAHDFVGLVHPFLHRFQLGLRGAQAEFGTGGDGLREFFFQFGQTRQQVRQRFRR